MEKKLKIAIVDDDPNILIRYKRFIAESEEMEVIDTIYSVESFLKHIQNYKVLDVLLLDIDLPGMSGIDAIGKIKNKLPNINIIMLTTYNNSDTIFKALRSGADGYLVKDFTKREFQKMMLTLKEGGSPLSPQVAKKIITHFNPPLWTRLSGKNGLGISKTEKDVLHHLVKGLSYQETADQMNLSINTVRHHVRNIYKKLEVNSRAKLIDKYKSYFNL